MKNSWPSVDYISILKFIVIFTSQGCVAMLSGDYLKSSFTKEMHTDVVKYLDGRWIFVIIMWKYESRRDEVCDV